MSLVTFPFASSVAWRSPRSLRTCRFFFLKPRPLQFGVSVQGGCEVTAAAITAKLALEPSSAGLSSDLKNAFNSYCRPRMWDVLRENFPYLYSLVLLMYGDGASVLFPRSVYRAQPTSLTRWVHGRAGALALSSSAWRFTSTWQSWPTPSLTC